MDNIAKYVNSVLMNELMGNIRSLKHLNGPPIWMINIGHQAYNGMIGHAPSIDQGKFLGHLIAKKNYDIRVSDDPSYTQQWEKTFYTVPGPNEFGKKVIDSLLATENGHRIYVDLKHSDVTTRKYFFDSVMVRKINKYVLDTIPPICSHCGATGLPLEYYSPFVNEYNLIKTSFTESLYPFSINLYDDEITKICTHHGIIGIPLEQRVLGGYINNKVTRNYYISKRGMKDDNKKQLCRRWKNNERFLTYYWRKHDPDVLKAIAYTQNVMGVEPAKSRDSLHQLKPIFKALCRDYDSVEPFLQNVFHIVDKSGLKPVDAWHHICIGSDLDGLIDPIDICPTASEYPVFRTRVEQFIPIFLNMRKDMCTQGKVKSSHDYFKNREEITNAMNEVFYTSLRDFTTSYFKTQSNPVE